MNGCVAIMTATFATLVICRAGINATIARVDSEATSQPLGSIATRLCKPRRPSVIPRKTEIRMEANMPRQNRMVQELCWRRRVKNGAVLQAIAAAMTRTIPNRRCDRASVVKDWAPKIEADRTWHRSNRSATGWRDYRRRDRLGWEAGRSNPPRSEKIARARLARVRPVPTVRGAEAFNRRKPR